MGQLVNNNEYNSAHKLFDYDELNDYFIDNNHYKYHDAIPQKRHKQLERSHNIQYSSQIMEDNNDDTQIASDEEQYSDKNQLTAFLLSLFLGWIAAGRFYVGDFQT